MGNRPDPINRALKAISTEVPDIPQDALFEMDTKTGDENVSKKSPRAKTVYSMPCPECMAKKIGVVRIYDRELGQHIEKIRAHNRITRKGHHFPCPASDRRVDE